MKRCVTCKHWFRKTPKNKQGECLNTYANNGWEIDAWLSEHPCAEAYLITHRLFGCVKHKVNK